MRDEEGDRAVVRALREALSPHAAAVVRRDLWPEVARRLAAPRAAPTRLDWAIAAAAGLWLLMFPQGLAVLLYLL